MDYWTVIFWLISFLLYVVCFVLLLIITYVIEDDEERKKLFALIGLSPLTPQKLNNCLKIIIWSFCGLFVFNNITNIYKILERQFSKKWGVEETYILLKREPFFQPEFIASIDSIYRDKIEIRLSEGFHFYYSDSTGKNMDIERGEYSSVKCLQAKYVNRKLLRDCRIFEQVEIFEIVDEQIKTKARIWINTWTPKLKAIYSTSRRDSVYAFIKRANEAYNQDNWEEAYRHYCTATTIDPGIKIGHIWFQLGVAATHIRGGEEEAVRIYDKVLKINPESGPAWNNRGYCLLELERFYEALDCYNKAIKIDSKNNLYWRRKGWILLRIAVEVTKKKAEVLKALGCYLVALEIDPTDQEAKDAKDMIIEMYKISPQQQNKLESLGKKLLENPQLLE